MCVYQDRSGETRSKAGTVQDRTVKAGLPATKVCEESETRALGSDDHRFQEEPATSCSGQFSCE